MRSWLCLALIACAGSSATDDAAPPPHLAAPPPPSAAPAVLATPPGPKVPVGPLTAPHGSEITTLAALDDGSAVVTVDLHGGLRLWPVLDGTREPVVVIAPAAKSLAVLRDGDGFTIGVLDAAGGLHVIRTTGAGAVRERLTLAGDAAVTQLEATTDRLLALRADQTLDVIDPAGVAISHLPAEPGSHVDQIVTRGHHALALILEDKQVHGRWIELAGRPGWGKSTGQIGGPGKLSSAALSPDGDLLAINRPRSVHPVLFDLAAGVARSTPLCVSKGWPRAEGFDMDEAELLREGTAPFVLGFLTNGVVACSVLTQVNWWSTNGEAVASNAGGLVIGASPFAVTSSAVLVGQSTNLGITTIGETRFLGYGLHNIAHMHTGPGGALINSDSAVLELGSDLAVRSRFDTSHGRLDWTDARPLDERYAVILRGKRSYRAEAFVLSVFDGVAATVRQALPYDVRDGELSYEPSTRLLATSDGGNAILLAFDPSSHTFGAPTRIGDGNLAGKLRVVDPSLADGVAALKLDDAGGGLKVSEILARDVVAGGVAVPQRSYRVPGELRAIDRAGRLYMRDAEQGDVTVYRHGVAGATLPGMAALTLRPNADGSRIVASDTPRIVMFDATGRVVWDVQHWNNQELGWLPDGGLIAQFTTGVATVDLATGALTRRRCGWSFGLSDQAFDQGQPVPSLCDSPK